MAYLRKDYESSPCPRCGKPMCFVARIIHGHCSACMLSDLTADMIEHHFTGKTLAELRKVHVRTQSERSA